MVMVSLHTYGTPSPSKCKDDVEQSPSQGGITVEGNLEQLNGDLLRRVQQLFFPFAYEQVTYVSSWIVGRTLGDVCFVHWSRPLAIRGSIGVIYSFEIVHESSWLYVCMYVWSSFIARVWINRVRLPILLVFS